MSTSAEATGAALPVAPSPLAAGLTALRRFWRPFLLIQAGALALALAFHLSPGVRAACAAAAAWKTSAGLPFAAATGLVAGGLLPELAKLIALGRRALAGRRGEILFNAAFFAVNGVIVDLLYRGEARLFGAGGGARTVVEKVAFDQFVFTPTWLAVIVLLFLWRQRAYSLARTLPALREGFYRQRVLPLLLPDWLFWIPMVSVIYALPVALQFLMFIPALGAWSLIMVFIADRP
jgi:hypothetical protein